MGGVPGLAFESSHRPSQVLKKMSPLISRPLRKFLPVEVVDLLFLFHGWTPTPSARALEAAAQEYPWLRACMDYAYARGFWEPRCPFQIFLKDPDQVGMGCGCGECAECDLRKIRMLVDLAAVEPEDMPPVLAYWDDVEGALFEAYAFEERTGISSFRQSPANLRYPPNELPRLPGAQAFGGLLRGQGMDPQDLQAVLPGPRGLPRGA